MKTRFLLSLISIFLILSLSSCDLPEITPPATSAPPTNPVPNPTLNLQPAPATEAPTQVPTEISQKNASSLTTLNKSAINNVQQITWSSDSQTIALITQVFDADGAQLFGVSLLNIPDLAPKGIYSTKDNRVTAVSSDCKYAAVISLDMNTFSIIDLANGNAVVKTIAPGFMIANVTFSPDNKYIAVTQIDSWQVFLYDLATIEQVTYLTGFETAAPVFDAGFSKSPQWMVWKARGTLQLQEISSGTMGARFEHEDFITTYSLSGDGTILATAAAKTVNGNMSPAVTLWDAVQGNELITLVFTDPVYTLDFSPNAKMLVVGSAAKLQILDSTSGELLTSIEEHSSNITSVSWSPDGKFIASSGGDNQLILWTVFQ